MDKCIHDCQHCSIAGRRPFQDMSMEEQDDFWQDINDFNNKYDGLIIIGALLFVYLLLLLIPFVD